MAGVGRRIEAMARALAMVGGVLLLAAGALTVASVIGRALVPFGLAPIKGDFELVSMACAVTVFAFLPWCQLKRGHVTVDVLANALPPRVNAALGLIGDALMTVIAAIILWRLWLAFGERFPYGGPGLRSWLALGERPFFPERSSELSVPFWIPYGGAVAGAALFLVACLYTVVRSARWTWRGHEGAV